MTSTPEHLGQPTIAHPDRERGRHQHGQRGQHYQDRNPFVHADGGTHKCADPVVVRIVPFRLPELIEDAAPRQNSPRPRRGF